MGHTDVVPVSPRRVAPRPVRRRADRRRGVGPRRHRHAQPHGVDGRRHQHLARQGWRPRGTLVYLGVADEEAGGHHGADWLVAPRARRGGRRLRDHRVGRLDVHGPAGASVVVTVGEKGAAWRRLRVHGTPGPRLDALRRRQRPRQRRPRWSGASPPTGPAAEINDVWRAVRGVARPRRRDPRRAGRSGPGLGGVRVDRRCAHGQVRPRLHAHHVLARRGARRHEDQRHPRRGRAGHRHPHPPRPDRRRRGPHAGRRPRARSPPPSPSSRSTTGPARRARPTRRCGTPSPPRGQGAARGHAAAPHHRRAAPTPRSSATPGASPMASASCPRPSPTRTSPPLPRQRRAHRRRVAPPHDAVLAGPVP